MNVAQPQLRGLAGGKPAYLPARIDRAPHRLATGMLLAFLFLLMSRGFEFLGLLTGSLHPALVLMLICGVAAILSGNILLALRSPVGLMFTMLTCWLLAATATSQWRGGSVHLLISYWVSAYASVVLIPSLISTVQQCRQAAYAIGFSLILLLLSTAIFETQVGGRDQNVFGSLGNPNDLAFSLLLLVPFAAFIVRNEGFNWKTILSSAAIAIALVKTLRTGSRGGLVAICFCLVVLFVTGRLKTKIKILALSALIAVAGLAFVSGDVWRRYGTLFSGTTLETQMSPDEKSAVLSSQAREMLFRESVRMTFEHPLFGVGPGIFSAALAGEQKARGEEQSWREAHNSFTQLSSEAGLPALAIYLGALIYCLKKSISIYRQARGNPDRVLIFRLSGTIVMALAIFVICGSFGTYSYTFHFPVLAGLLQALDMAIQEQGARVAPAAAPAPAPLPQRPEPSAGPRKSNEVSNYVRNRRVRNRRV